MPAVQMAQHDFAGIKATVRFSGRGVNVRYDTSETFSEEVNFTDATLFELFNFPLVAGDGNLNDRDAVLITETTAKKYFGPSDPIGQTMLFSDSGFNAKVTGVMKDLPENSTIRLRYSRNSLLISAVRRAIADGSLGASSRNSTSHNR